MNQQKIHIEEQRIPKYMPTRNGCEVTSNNDDIRICFNHSFSFIDDMEQEHFTAIYFVKEGDGWLRTNTVKPYRSMDDFIRDLSDTEEFTQAIRDYKELV